MLIFGNENMIKPVAINLAWFLFKPNAECPDLSQNVMSIDDLNI